MIKYYMIKNLILLKIQNMVDINEDLLQWFTNFLINSSGCNTYATRTNKFAGGAVKSEIVQNKELAKELQQPIIKKSEKRKVHSSFIGNNIWGANNAVLQLISLFDKRIHFSLCVIDIYSKNAWVVPLIDKKGITITNAFQRVSCYCCCALLLFIVSLFFLAFFVYLATTISNFFA